MEQGTISLHNLLSITSLLSTGPSAASYDVASYILPSLDLSWADIDEEEEEEDDDDDEDDDDEIIDWDEDEDDEDDEDFEDDEEEDEEF